jgi:hypothetical protein
VVTASVSRSLNGQTGEDSCEKLSISDEKEVSMVPGCRSWRKAPVRVALLRLNENSAVFRAASRGLLGEWTVFGVVPLDLLDVHPRRNHTVNRYEGANFLV